MPRKFGSKNRATLRQEKAASELDSSSYTTVETSPLPLPNDAEQNTTADPAAESAVKVTTIGDGNQNVEPSGEVNLQDQLTDTIADTMEGTLTEEQLTTLFRLETKALDATLGKGYGFDADTAKLLGRAGVRPLNRLFARYGGENSEMALFVTALVLAHIQIPIKLFQEKKISNPFKKKLPKFPEIPIERGENKYGKSFQDSGEGSESEKSDQGKYPSP